MGPKSHEYYNILLDKYLICYRNPEQQVVESHPSSILFSIRLMYFVFPAEECVQEGEMHRSNLQNYRMRSVGLKNVAR